MNEKTLKQLTQEEILEYRETVLEQKREYSKKIEACLYQNFDLIVDSYKEINALEEKLSQFNLIFDEQKNAITSLTNIIGLNTNSTQPPRRGDSALHLIDSVSNIPLGYHELRGRTILLTAPVLSQVRELQLLVTEDTLLLCSNDGELAYSAHYNLSDINLRCVPLGEGISIELLLRAGETFHMRGQSDEDTQFIFDDIKRAQLQAGKFSQRTDAECLLSSVENLPEMDMDVRIVETDQLVQVNPATLSRVRTVKLFLLSRSLILAQGREDKYIFVKMTNLSLVAFGDGASNYFTLRMDDETFHLVADSSAKKDKWRSLLDSPETPPVTHTPLFDSKSFDICLQSRDFLAATKLVCGSGVKCPNGVRDELVRSITFEVESILEKPARAQFCDLSGLVVCLGELGMTKWGVDTFLHAKTREFGAVLRTVRMECDFRAFVGGLVEVGYYFIIATFLQFRRVFEPRALAMCLVWVRSRFVALLQLVFGHLLDSGRDISTVAFSIDHLTASLSSFSRYNINLLPQLHLTVVTPLSNYLTEYTKTYIKAFDLLRETGKLISFSNAATCLKFTQKYLDSLPNLKLFVAGNVLNVTQTQWALSQRNLKFICLVLSLPVDNCYEVVLGVVVDVMVAHMNLLGKMGRSVSGTLMEYDIEFVVGCLLPAVSALFMTRFALEECPHQIKKLENYFKIPS